LSQPPFNLGFINPHFAAVKTGREVIDKDPGLQVCAEIDLTNGRSGKRGGALRKGSSRRIEG
jgi:hypothetical protein